MVVSGIYVTYPMKVGSCCGSEQARIFGSAAGNGNMVVSYRLGKNIEGYTSEDLHSVN